MMRKRSRVEINDEAFDICGLLKSYVSELGKVRWSIANLAEVLTLYPLNQHKKKK